MTATEEPIFVVDLSQCPPMCLPASVYQDADLQDITRLQDAWRRYVDMRTGEIHDGSIYAEQWRALEMP